MKRLIAFCMLGFLALMSSARAATIEDAITYVHRQWGTLKPDNETSATHAASMSAALINLKQQWAILKYQTADKVEQHNGIATLLDQVERIVDDYPGKAEPLIWQAIILSTKADINGGLGALGDDQQARDLLLQAEKINPLALEGSIYSLLGSLYYKVPGWPIGFGDDDQAKRYFEKALTINPDGIDPNFLYGEYLYETGDYENAKLVLEHGLKSRQPPDEDLAQRARREEARELLQKVNQKLS